LICKQVSSSACKVSKYPLAKSSVTSRRIMETGRRSDHLVILLFVSDLCIVL
jgi:NIMA (never in mitosis gene a)-related kinase